MISRPVRISASLLSADFANLGRDVKAAEDAGCDEIHFDVMDGHFVPNLTFGAPVLQAVRKVTRLPIAAVEEALDYADSVLVMTVNPGFGGQKFISGVLPKMARLAGTIRVRGLPVDVGVDGGIKSDTARQAVEAGAHTLVSGSGIFGHALGLEAAVRELRLAAAGA